MRVRPLLIGCALLAIAAGCLQPGAPPPEGGGGGGGPVGALSPYPSPSPLLPPPDAPGAPVMLPPIGDAPGLAASPSPSPGASPGS